jgi:hypothetical protein
MSFNVVIDSENAYATTSIYDKDYAFDWSVFERNCKYEMTYSFKSSPIADVDSDVECIALVGLGTQQRTFTAGNKTTTQTNNIIGLLNRQTIREADAGHEKQYYTQPSVKPNIYLTNTPANNIFKVRIQSGNGDVATAGLTGSNYILILHFNKVEDGNKTY